MKKIVFIGSFLMTFGQIFAQSISPSNTKNYIYTKDCLDADCIKKAETVQYFDGLGRPKQIVGVKASPTQKDVVGHIEYDADGRISKSYLPVPQTGTQNGAIYENPLNNAANPEIYGAEKIYSKQVLENFPLARVKETYNVGNAWSDKPVRYGYSTNISPSEVKKYGISTSWAENRTDSQLSFNGSYYPVNSLMKTSVTDEDGNVTTEYKNGKDQVVLIRNNDGVHNLDTYYLYNEYNQLAFVIPPLASALTIIDETKQNSLCYQYRYDEFGRLVEKKVPGKGWEYMVYDKQDRLVAIQDTELKKKGQWLYTKYDLLGRVAITGVSTGGERSQEQNIVNGYGSNNVNRINTAFFERQGMDVYYDNPDTTYPNSTKWVTLLSLNYYDTYPPLPSGMIIPAQILGQDVLSQDAQNSSISTKSLPTASYVKNIEDDRWTRMYSFYDTKGRSIGVYSANYLGGYTRTETEVDFMGVTQRSITKHKRTNVDIEKTVTETFEYDLQNRLLAHKHQVDSNPVEILTQTTYNELSQVKNKKVGGTSTVGSVQDIDYAYNIRGWVTKINDPKNLNGKLFGYEIKYNQVEGLQTPNAEYTDLQVKPRYNGNIAEVDWKTASTPNDNLRRYGYTYDAANRLLAGFYQRDDNPSAQEYYEKVDYDFNGNITKLKRTGAKANETVAAAIDNLTYDYAGNRLLTITDSSMDYRGYPDTSANTNVMTYYEENGNLKSQKDKGILDIKYNYLDLPNYITFDKTYIPRFILEGNERVNVNTRYLYRADGVKLSKTYTYGSGKTNLETSSITDYLDGFQYERISTGGKLDQPVSLKFVPTSEGYYDFENSRYIYNYKDHLGNVRLSYYKNTNGNMEVLEENNYYPFGLKHNGYNLMAGNPGYRYGYNGHELQDETGWYDYGFRNYMPDIGRFGVIDPLADTTLQPYSYASNNPILFIDFLGLKSTPPNNSNGYSIGQVWTDGEGWWERVDSGWKNTKTNEMAVDEIELSGGGGGGSGFSLAGIISSAIISMGDSVNSMLTSAFFGLSSNQSMRNYQQNLSNFQLAVKNSKAAQSTEEAERFLFLELPASFAGGELISLGWRAANLSRFICRPLGNLSKGLIKLCFTEGTLVVTEKGSKKIEDIQEGDLVWSYNEETGKKELKKVVELSRNTSSSLVKIFVNGTEITCTPEHPFYVNGSWVEAKDLTQGMLLTTLDGKNSHVESINFLDEKVKVYNFEVEDNHNYYVSEKGFLVHNDCHFTNELLGYVGKYTQVFDGSVNMGWLTGDIMEVQVSGIVRANSAPKNAVFKALTEGAESMARKYGMSEVRIQFNMVMNQNLKHNSLWAREYGYFFSREGDTVFWEKVLH
ncbi:polymorphic toxin-type HINT domain-containing protein [Chryseobacterium arthrosphaerae]|uniref:DUF6443 domain-containing protein n=1 Tax=Chryseobacterium arthrosphaerae TaxID=651561 RepID=UPI0031D6EA09